jgi:hypothetical protein
MMKKALLLMAALLAAQSSFSGRAPNLYSCEGDGLKIVYGTTDAFGEPYVSTPNATYPFDIPKNDWLWTRTVEANGATLLQGKNTNSFLGLDFTLALPGISLDTTDKATFRAQMKYHFMPRYPMEGFDPDQTLDLTCEASFIP